MGTVLGGLAQGFRAHERWPTGHWSSADVRMAPAQEAEGGRNGNR